MRYLLKIQLMNSCNRDCYYCPSKKWMYPVGFKFPYNGNNDIPIEVQETYRLPINAITNEALLKWLDAYLPADKWHIELTGGEPGLYPEIDTLMPELAKRGYKGLIRTNGSLPIPKAPGWRRLTCWHTFWGKELPTYYDVLAIIRNPEDDWEWKEQYCKENDIPYQLFLYDTSWNGGSMIIDGCQGHEDVKFHHYAGITYINSMGQNSHCQRITVDSWNNPDYKADDFSITAMKPPLVMDHECVKCIHLLQTEIAVTDDMKYEIYDGWKEPW